MPDPYEKCPVFESEKYLLRFVEMTDAPDLLLVYSDVKVVPLFNSDNCNGDDFRYTTLERMQSQIDFWLEEYGERCYVRWTIVDKTAGQAVGTVELFNRRSEDHFTECGILRLDLRSDHERSERIAEILSVFTQPAYDMFDCKMIATKIPPFASERIKAAKSLGYTATDEKLRWYSSGLKIHVSWVRIPLHTVPCPYQQRCKQQ